MLLTPALMLLAVQPEQPIVVDADRLRRDPAAVICKSQPQRNSRFRARTCKTRADWDRMSEVQQREWHDLVDGPKFDTREH